MVLFFVVVVFQIYKSCTKMSKVVVTVATTQKGNSNGDWKCNFGSRQAVEVIILVIYNIIFCSKKCGVTGKPGWFY